MPVACALGLAACLNFAGADYPAQTALEILDECDQLADLPAASFVQHTPESTADVRRAAMASWGAATGEGLRDKGLKLEWPPGPAQRQAAWIATCRRFEQAFNDKSRWTHLERWPW